MDPSSQARRRAAGSRCGADDDLTASFHSRPGWLTYATFYGLKDKPFGLSSDPPFFYNSGSHATALDELLSGIRRRESLCVVSGEVGTGRTTLCRTVLRHLDQQTFSAFVADPRASREDLLKVILVDFGVVPADDLSSARLRSASRTELTYLLHKFLATLPPLQAFAVVFVDEAQNLSPSLIEEVRILSDSNGGERQLQIVLVGQPELHEKLQLPEMRQVVQRVAVRCNLRPLDRDGMEGYIAHRLHAAGGAPDRVRFSHDALDLAYDATGGVPRVINRLCDRALHHGHLRRAAVIERETFALACVEAELAHRASTPAARNDAPKKGFDRAEAWFAEMDACVNPDRGVNIAAELADRDEANVVPLTPRAERRPPAPQTRRESFRRASLQWLKIAVLLLVLFAGAGFGLTVAAGILSHQAASAR